MKNIMRITVLSLFLVGCLNNVQKLHSSAPKQCPEIRKEYDKEKFDPCSCSDTSTVFPNKLQAATRMLKPTVGLVTKIVKLVKTFKQNIDQIQEAIDKDSKDPRSIFKMIVMMSLLTKDVTDALMNVFEIVSEAPVPTKKDGTKQTKLRTLSCLVLSRLGTISSLLKEFTSSLGDILELVETLYPEDKQTEEQKTEGKELAEKIQKIEEKNTQYLSEDEPVFDL